MAATSYSESYHAELTLVDRQRRTPLACGQGGLGGAPVTLAGAEVGQAYAAALTRRKSEDARSSYRGPGPAIRAGRSGCWVCPPAFGGLGLTRRQLLSQHVESRRRELLAKELNAWCLRACAAGLAVAMLAAHADELDLAECHATAGDVRHLRGKAWKRWVYALRRVRSLSRDLAPRAEACGRRNRYVRCRCNEGEPIPVPESCHQRMLCHQCRFVHAQRTRKRLLDALDRHRAAWRDDRNRLGAVRMLTLTIGHSGDLARDRAELYRGWKELRKRFHRWWSPLGRGAVPFALVWEWTAGEDGKGHVHAHVLVVGGPRWWNYNAILGTWKRVCPRSTGLDIQWARSSKSAALYVSKYVSKGTALTDSMSDEVQAQTLAASYNKRAVSTSLRFWNPPDRRCKCCGFRFYPAQPKHHRYTFAAKLPCRRVLVEDDWSIAGALDAMGARPYHPLEDTCSSSVSPSKPKPT